MNDAELIRYSRHLLLEPLGVPGQAALRQARVLVVGVGGLGCPAAQYLAVSGVGSLILVDGDTVDATNLQRQVLHNEATVGWPKVESAKKALDHLAPGVKVETRADRLDEAGLCRLAADADLILDCCDNFPTRHAINRAAVALKKPLVSGAAVRWDGQLTVFDPRMEQAPCYHCLFPDTGAVPEDEERCSALGVLAPLTGVMGTLQAAQAILMLAGIGQPLIGRLLLVNMLDGLWREIRYRRDPDCPVCCDQSPA